MRWFRRRKIVVCARCRRVNARGQVCGTLKRETTNFPDGGWVEFRAWNPCSEHAPGGVVVPDASLPECGDLDDLMSECDVTVVK